MIVSSKFTGIGWEAEALLSPIEKMDGIHVYCTTKGDTCDLALEGADFVLRTLALDREAYIRSWPIASSDTDFDTKEVKHRGFVRFSVLYVSGKWNDVTSSGHNMSLGNAPHLAK